MKLIKKILVPTDFSEHAVYAYSHAMEIAQKFEAKIDFIHVIPTLSYFTESLSPLGAPLDMSDDLYPTAQKVAKKKLYTAMQKHIEEKFRGEIITHVDRKPSTTIEDVAQTGSYDLVIMASKGEHDSNLLRGSTAQKVIRHCKVPVFTVDTQLSSKKLNHILLPTDGSLVSFSALPLALTLAGIYDAEITLLHIIELYGDLLDSEHKDPTKTDEVNDYEIIIERIENYLIKEKVNDVHIKRGEIFFEDQFVITEGELEHKINFYTVIKKAVSAHYGIEEYATANADVVLMTTHGRGGLAHFFLGSTTEKVAHLPLPVITVKPDVGGTGV